MKLISFAAARQLRYVRLCQDLGFRGDIRDRNAWGDQLPNDLFQDAADICGYPSDIGRFALVEHSRYSQIWVTLHNSLDEAAEQNVKQEYAEDWIGATITDLACGVVYDVELRGVAVPIMNGGRA